MFKQESRANFRMIPIYHIHPYTTCSTRYRLYPNLVAKVEERQPKVLHLQKDTGIRSGQNQRTTHFVGHAPRARAITDMWRGYPPWTIVVGKWYPMVSRYFVGNPAFGVVNSSKPLESLGQNISHSQNWCFKQKQCHAQWQDHPPFVHLENSVPMCTLNLC